MGSLWIKEFTGGLDARRLPETTSGGVLLQATDGHITRGGEFEKRPAFVPYATLPFGTYGLAALFDRLTVFGSGPNPGLPNAIGYIKCDAPNGAAMASVLGGDLFAGLPVTSVQFDDGNIRDFYNGTLITDFNDGRAQGTLTLSDGQNSAAVGATGYVTITGGTSGTFGFVSVGGVQITSGQAITFSNTNQMAADIAADINRSYHGFTATANGSTFVITSTNPGAGGNGQAIVGETTGDLTYSGSGSTSGGADAQLSRYGVRANGQSLTGGPVPFDTDLPTTAADIAGYINARTTATGFTAVNPPGTADIIIAYITAGTQLNGTNIVTSVGQGGAFANATVALSGGRALGSQPGSFVLTVGAKVYVASGPNLLFSGVDKPDSFGADTTGAGFIDMSSQASGSEQIYALGRYQKYLAIFSGRQTQIWYVDPDPDQNQQVQVLYNTGTFAPGSIVGFGDNDLFYLDETGIRSLRARDASNAATTDDVGVPIDPLIVAKLRSLSMDDRKRVRSCVEPTEGRIWISIVDTIYVFSYFATAKVSAWTTYIPGFDIDELVVWNQRVFIRSGQNLYTFGGTNPAPIYDDTSAQAQIPYQDGGKPTIAKTWNTLDAAVRGTWDFQVATDPNNLDQREAVMTATQTTYNAPDATMDQRSTHCSVIARSRGPGYALLGSLVLGYEDGSSTRPDGGDP